MTKFQRFESFFQIFFICYIKNIDEVKLKENMEIDDDVIFEAEYTQIPPSEENHGLSTFQENSDDELLMWILIFSLHLYKIVNFQHLKITVMVMMSVT